MAKKSKAKKAPSTEKKEVGRPSLYQDDFPQKLIAHMAKGGGFPTFGATLEPAVSHQTVYDWADAHPEFLEAKSIGEAKAEIYWENLLKAGASGQLRRLKSRDVKMSGGKPVTGPDGKLVYEEEFESATFNATATIFALKNKFPSRWRDRKEIDVGGKKDAPVRIAMMTKADAKNTMKKMLAIMAEAAADEDEEQEE